MSGLFPVIGYAKAPKLSTHGIPIVPAAVILSRLRLRLTLINSSASSELLRSNIPSAMGNDLNER